MGEVTTFCTLWKFTFPRRANIYLTDHDAVVNYDGAEYSPLLAADKALSESKTGLSVDMGGLRTSLTLPDVSSQDIRDGLFDGAQLLEFRHDWRNGETALVQSGRLGEVIISGDEMTIEWLGQASLLDQSTGRVFSRQCDAIFGDARCGLNKDNFTDGTACPRSFEACRDQFSNTINFRGFPYLLGDDVLLAGVAESDRRDGSSRYR